MIDGVVKGVKGTGKDGVKGTGKDGSWTCKYDVGMGYYYECPKCKLRIDAKDIVLGRMNIETCPQCHASLDSSQDDYDKMSNWLQTEHDYKEF